MQHFHWPQEVLCGDILDFVPESPLEVDHKIFVRSLKRRVPPRGASPGFGGCTCEHFRVVLVWTFGTCCSRPLQVWPVWQSQITAVFMGARVTALQKPDGGVIDELVARILAIFEVKCVPFQDTLSIRAGTDCVGPFSRCHQFGPRRHHSECGWHWRTRLRHESCCGMVPRP